MGKLLGIWFICSVIMIIVAQIIANYIGEDDKND